LAFVESVPILESRQYFVMLVLLVILLPLAQGCH